MNGLMYRDEPEDKMPPILQRSGSTDDQDSSENIHHNSDSICEANIAKKYSQRPNQTAKVTERF